MIRVKSAAIHIFLLFAFSDLLVKLLNAGGSSQKREYLEVIGLLSSLNNSASSLRGIARQAR